MTTIDAYSISEVQTHQPRAGFPTISFGRLAAGVIVVGLSVALWVLIGMAAWTLLSVWR